ncbi:MAG: LPS export ABC transporter periplasmic protein LptC [Alphaproteobacteria bacterium]
MDQTADAAGQTALTTADSLADGTARGRRMAAMIDAASMRRRGGASTGYSRFVQGMRLVLPTIAVLLVLAVALWPEFSEIENAIVRPDIPIDIRDADRLTMSNPRYMSRDKDGAAYTVTADEAEQQDTADGGMRLSNPAADVILEDGSWVMLQALTGEYWDQERLLELVGDVALFHDAGYEFHTQQATIDFASGRAEGHAPVDGFGAFGDIESEGFAIEERGRVIIFTGRAHMVLRLEEGPTAP